MRKISILLIFLVFISILLYSYQKGEEYFIKGLVYYLINDKNLAKENFNIYFNNYYTNPHVQRGFSLLLENKLWDAMRRFNSYLETYTRELPALVGIALSMENMKDNTSIENLQRAIRFNSVYSPAYLCLGYYYLKVNDYPKAEKNFNIAYRFSEIPEIKILISQLYLKMNEYELAFNMIKNEVEQFPQNYYFNFLAANSLLNLDKSDQALGYIDNAINLKRNSKEAILLKTRILLKLNKPDKAKKILLKLKFENYNPEYVKTLAETYVYLKERKALKYLFEYFYQNQWDKDINRLIALYYFQKNDKKKDYWVKRALISGNSKENLKKYISEDNIPEMKSLNFFKVKKIKWLDKNSLIVIGKKNSGDSDAIFIIDIKTLKIIKSIKLKYNFKELFLTKSPLQIIIVTQGFSKTDTFLFVLNKIRRNFILEKINNYPFTVSKMLYSFNSTKSLLYMTDFSLLSFAFESPFSLSNPYGKKRYLYPTSIIPIYVYNTKSKSLMKLKRLSQLQTVPIKEVKNYLMISYAYNNIKEIRDLINEGMSLDLTASKSIKVFFSSDNMGFIIYENPTFKGYIYNSDTDKTYYIDKKEFLGKKSLKTFKIVDMDLDKNILILLTNEEDKTLITYNYESNFHSKISGDVLKALYKKDSSKLISIVERANKIYYSQTMLKLTYFKPFFTKNIKSRNDIKSIFNLKGTIFDLFTTYDGRLIQMDDEYNFHEISFSPEGLIMDFSENNKKLAFFINKKLVILNIYGII